jgi:hypothetical protein
MNPAHRQKVAEIVTYTAGLFDEVMFDDFVFTNCKCEACIAGKGSRTWTEFRLELMRQSVRELIVRPAKRVNPKVKLVLKFPNWYEHFQGLGYDLETEPLAFDAIYTGTETRQPAYNAQHLQQYQSYQIVRYFENLAPGRNDGGWVDTFGMMYADRYAEQLSLTLLAKAKEVTLFDFRLMQLPLTAEARASWQGQGTSFDFDEVTSSFRQADGSFSPRLTLARIAGATFERIDGVLAELGTPMGVGSYKPFHSTGEDFLHNYLGMIGIPIDLRPQFPGGTGTVLLTESAAYDGEIVDKIKRHLVPGGRVVMTSGLLKALRERGFDDVSEIRWTERKVVTDEFHFRGGGVFRGEGSVVLPVIDYVTNDAWEVVGSHANSSPLLLEAPYGKGALLVLAVPDNFADLYRLPPEALDRLRVFATRDMPARLEGPSQVSLFVFDNGSFVVASFRPEPVTVRVVLDAPAGPIRDLSTGQRVAGERRAGRPGERGDGVVHEITLKPHSYRALRVD